MSGTGAKSGWGVGGREGGGVLEKRKGRGGDDVWGHVAARREALAGSGLAVNSGEFPQ